MEANASSRELEAILVPISAEHPSGESLRYEGAYDRIAAARREDDATLTQGVWKSSLKRADWNEVESLCVEELETRTKDLQIAAWLVEAWLHLHHFVGVTHGLELLRELVARFWDTLYPQIEDGDLEYRIAPINWINEKLSIQVKLLAITHPDGGDVPAYCWADWENACRTEVSDPSLRPAAAGARPSKLTLAEFQKSVMFTSTDFFAGLAAEIEGTMEACGVLEADLDRLCGKQTPSLRQFFAVLDSIHSFLISTLNQRQPEEESPLGFSGGNSGPRRGGAGGDAARVRKRPHHQPRRSLPPVGGGSGVPFTSRTPQPGALPGETGNSVGKLELTGVVTTTGEKPKRAIRVVSSFANWRAKKWG